ncbi:MAG: serine/threonine-protein kinase [Myxococcota bacterium]|nr:serine/threonine-protein kinase [Myxococcota bacterium]
MSGDLIGKELLGQFRITERIGRGGMGEVYKAEQPAMDRMVAIKILHARLASRPDLVSRFRREARAMSRLSHPNTARVFLYGHIEASEQLYIVMEYLKGVDLARWVRREGPMPMERALKVMIQVLGALEEAHSVGVIHRDLKPENILLTTQGGIADFPKVLDFGLAKVRETRLRPGSVALTREGMVFGTPEFMSPEQARGETLDAKSDIYSAGLILYELLTGRLPYPKCKPMEYISHQIYTQPMPVTERVPELNLPVILDPIIAKALEKEPEKRFASALAFGEALRDALPRSDPTDPIQIHSGDATGAIGMTHSRAGQLDEKSRVGGRGFVIGLLAVIVVLLGLVIWLFATRK